jgi:hypothetical protein
MKMSLVLVFCQALRAAFVTALGRRALRRQGWLGTHTALAKEKQFLGGDIMRNDSRQSEREAVAP